MSAELLQEKLASLGACIEQKPPYCSGTFSPAPEDFVLFYGKDTARRMDLSTSSDEELKQLAHACDPATFGWRTQDVLDESFRKAGKLDLMAFATNVDPAKAGLLKTLQLELMEGQKQRPIRAELYKLNVYGPGSFFKPHIDTPRGETMFGSLVILFPTPHEGGTLVMRHHGKEWAFNPATLLTSQQTALSIAYIAFWSDVEHEVLPVVSGYRVTLTYNLYFDAEDVLSAVPGVQPVGLVETPFEAMLLELLGDPAFLSQGGLLGFGLRHKYPIPTKNLWRVRRDKVNPLEELKSYMKGSDAVLLHVLQKLRLHAEVQQLFPTRPDTEHDEGSPAILCEEIVNLQGMRAEQVLWCELRERKVGKLVTDFVDDECTFYKRDMELHWVTQPVEELNSELSYIAYGNESWINHTYAQPCLIVNIGEFGKRETAE